MLLNDTDRLTSCSRMIQDILILLCSWMTRTLRLMITDWFWKCCQRRNRKIANRSLFRSRSKCIAVNCIHINIGICPKLQFGRCSGAQPWPHLWDRTVSKPIWARQSRAEVINTWPAKTLCTSKNSTIKTSSFVYLWQFLIYNIFHVGVTTVKILVFLLTSIVHWS